MPARGALVHVRAVVGGAFSRRRLCCEVVSPVVRGQAPRLAGGFPASM